MIAEDQQALTEVEALRKDWYERVFTAIEKLDAGLDDLSKEARKIKDEIKEYSDKGDEKLEERLTNKLDDFLSKLDLVKSDSEGDVGQLRQDLKDEKESDKKGRRWFIGIVFVLALSAITAVGGYFISVEVISTKVETLITSNKNNIEWHNDHHDKIEKAGNTSERNREDIDDLRRDFRAYVQGLPPKK